MQAEIQAGTGVTAASTVQGVVTVLGSINVDHVVRVERFPRAGETLIATGAARLPGGKGANQAIAAARAGAAVRMIGAVGDDTDGRMMTAFLRDNGIVGTGVRTEAALPTGAAFVTVDARGENQIVVAVGANAATVAPARTEGVRLAQLEVPLGVVADFLAASCGDGPAVLNAAPFRADAAPLLALADVVIVNQTELAGYCGAAAPAASADEAAAMARGLLRTPSQTIVVTLGADGSVTVGPDGVQVDRGRVAAVVDTTGAGDCFCGYVAAGLAAGQPLAAAIADGHRAAALAVGRLGAAPSIPSRHELDAAN